MKITVNGEVDVGTLCSPKSYDEFLLPSLTQPGLVP